jgi:hypothetical protein
MLPEELALLTPPGFLIDDVSLVTRSPAPAPAVLPSCMFDYVFSCPASKETAIVLKEAESSGSGGQDRDADQYVMSVDPLDPFGACMVGLQSAGGCSNST